MADAKKHAPSAGEELRKQVLEAEQDVTGERERRGGGEAGDTLTTSHAAQRRAHGEGDAESEENEADGAG
jgi:hypothetical protein